MAEPDPHIANTENYLRLCGERRTAEAKLFLDERVTFVFPGTTYDRLEDVFMSAAAGYQSIRKHYLTWDVAPKPDGSVVVVSAGTLEGRNIHGVRFDGVRYLDRITWREGRIVLQEVWNDLAVSGVLSRRESSEAE